MKSALRNFLTRFGYEVLRTSSDPILQEMRVLHNRLRLVGKSSGEIWLHELCRLASTAYLREVIRNEKIDLIIDIGANCGQFALSCRKVGYKGRIVSFEPMKYHGPRLFALASADGDWQVKQVALGAAASQSPLNVFKDDSFSSLLPLADRARELFGDMVTMTHTEEVTVQTLDSLIDELCLFNASNILLKTDTQGYDLEVLQGAARVLGVARAVMTEVTVDPLYRGAPLKNKIDEFLTGLGFIAGGLFPIAFEPGSVRLLELDAYFVRATNAPKMKPLQ